MWGGAPAPRLAPWPASSGPFGEPAKPTRAQRAPPAAAQGGRPVAVQAVVAGTKALLTLSAGACWALLLAADQAAFERATEALRQGDHVGAESGFRSVLEANPRHLPALANLGVVYSQTRQYERAIEIYRRALTLAPGDARLQLNLGIAYFKQDRFGEAVPHLEKAGTSSQARELLAASYIYTDQAERSLGVLAGLDGRAPGVLYLLGLAHQKTGDRQRAQEAFAGLLGSATPAQSRFLLGKARYELGEFEEAARELEQASELPGAARELGKVYVSLRRNDDAERWLRKAVEQDGGDTEARYFLGGVLMQQDRAAEARPLFESVERDRPQFWGGHYYLGRLRLDAGNPAEAIGYLETAARLRPEEAAVFYQLGRAYRAAGRLQDAEAALERLGTLKAQAAAGDVELLRRR